MKESEVEKARRALRAYRDWLAAKGRDPKEASEYWVDRTMRGLKDAEIAEERRQVAQAEADRRHRAVQRSQKDMGDER